MLDQLVKKCKMLSICVNDHKDIGMPAYDYLVDIDFSDLMHIINDDIFKKMCEEDTIVEVSFCPSNNNLIVYKLFHYDVDKAIEQSLRFIENGELQVNAPKKDYLLLDFNDKAAKKAARCYAMAIKDYAPKKSIDILKKLG